MARFRLRVCKVSPKGFLASQCENDRCKKSCNFGYRATNAVLQFLQSVYILVMGFCYYWKMHLLNLNSLIYKLAMNRSCWGLVGRFFLIGVVLLFSLGHASSQSIDNKEIPEALEEWKDWATWGDLSASVPSVYNDVSRKLSVWPSALNLDVEDRAGSFSVNLEIYNETWVTLPGNRDAWPLEVSANDEEVAVMAINNLPSIRLTSGQWNVRGVFRWSEMPQFLVIPTNVGILNLKRNGGVSLCLAGMKVGNFG